MANTDTADRDRVADLEDFAGTNEPRRELVLTSGGTLTQITRAEVDSQVATARAYPRDSKLAKKNIFELTTDDEETIAEMMYAIPRGGKSIRGPSVRFAEVVAQCWGNSRITAQVVDVDRVNKVVHAEGTFHDLETNVALKVFVARRIVNSEGKLYNDDMIAVTGQAACSIARRNATLSGIPKVAWRRAFEAVELHIAGTVKTLGTRREAAMRAFAQFGVKPEQVLASLDLKEITDITLDHMPTLTGMYNALKNGDETVESMFPAKKPEPEQTKTEPEKTQKAGEPSNLDKLAEGSSGAPTKVTPPDGKAAEPGESRDKDQPRDSAAATPTQVDMKKPPAESVEQRDKSGGQPEPTTPEAYIKHFEQWFTNTADPKEAWRQWENEKALRNQLKVPEAERDRMKALVEAKVTGK